jgi:3-oxoadipate enol-lactonase
MTHTTRPRIAPQGPPSAGCGSPPSTPTSRGQLDASTTPEVMRRITAHMPGSEYREMPGAPHAPTLEAPALVTEALDRFLPRRNS